MSFILLAGMLPAVALAQAPDLTGTTLVSMKGTLVADQKTADDVGWGGISFGFTGDAANKTRWFGVVHATAFGGDTFDAKTAVFGAHYNPTLYLVGPPELVKQVLALPDGTRVQLEGAVELGSRNMMLDLVRKLPAQ
jgi:hypothetical protein